MSTRKNEGGSVSCGCVPNFHSQELEKAKKRKLVEQGMENKEGKNELASAEGMRTKKKKTTRDQR